MSDPEHIKDIVKRIMYTKYGVEIPLSPSGEPLADTPYKYTRFHNWTKEDIKRQEEFNAGR